MDKQQFLTIFDKLISKEGFKKRGVTWYRSEGDFIQVVNLQRSNFSNLYYVNICVTLFNGIQYPKEEHRDIRTRLDNTLIGLQKDYDTLFNLEHNNLSADEFESELNACIQDNILPQLALLSSKDGLLEVKNRNPIIFDMVALVIKKYWNIVE